MTPPRTALGGAPLFGYRGVLRMDAAVIALADAPATDVDAWLAFALQIDATGAEIRGDDGSGAARVELDSVPSSIYFLDDVEGWETVVYVDNPAASTLRGDRLLVQIAYPSGTSDFDMGPFADLDRERRLHVIAFAPPPPGSETVLRSNAGPCVTSDVPVDRIDVTLAEGSVSFHTRPALWRTLYGFTVLAQGQVDDVAFEVDEYWDLEYASGDMGAGAYGVSPLLAVRFPPAADGSCILVVAPDPMTVENEYFARLLDCDQNPIRDLAVESIDVVVDGGERRW